VRDVRRSAVAIRCPRSDDHHDEPSRSVGFGRGLFSSSQIGSRVPLTSHGRLADLISRQRLLAIIRLSSCVRPISLRFHNDEHVIWGPIGAFASGKKAARAKSVNR